MRKKVDLAGGTLSDTTIWDGFGGLSNARRSSFGYGKEDPWLKCVVVAGGKCDFASDGLSMLYLRICCH